MHAPPKPTPGELGYLQLSRDGAVLASRGCLQNDERTAGRVMALLGAALDPALWGEGGGAVSRVTVTLEEHRYVVCLANGRYHVQKRANAAVA